MIENQVGLTEKQLDDLQWEFMDMKEMTDEEYEAWFKEFVEGWRCRICKIPLTMDNFGGIGENHFIGCSDCKKDYQEYFYKNL